jgi:hypothetical protein
MPGVRSTVWLAAVENDRQDARALLRGSLVALCADADSAYLTREERISQLVEDADEPGQVEARLQLRDLVYAHAERNPVPQAAFTVCRGHRFAGDETNWWMPTTLAAKPCCVPPAVA